MKYYTFISITCLYLSGCVATVPSGPPRQVVYEAPAVVAPTSPVLVYPAQPLVGESIIIEGAPYYRHYNNHGHPYYHYARPRHR